ncbi:hypothetical protein WJX73_009493 [Symbiochloris irregularis]|uniref:Uncharacterized protein n=1 Tax=Symbiochloris irregularis TaxID=706552 RepID=A0AAW1PIL7_9CHLO
MNFRLWAQSIQDRSTEEKLLSQFQQSTANRESRAGSAVLGQDCRGCVAKGPASSTDLLSLQYSLTWWKEYTVAKLGAMPSRLRRALTKFEAQLLPYLFPFTRWLMRRAPELLQDIRGSICKEEDPRILQQAFAMLNVIIAAIVGGAPALLAALLADIIFLVVMVTYLGITHD